MVSALDSITARQVMIQFFQEPQTIAYGNKDQHAPIEPFDL